MNITLGKNEINLILNALESYQQDIEHGLHNAHIYAVLISEVENLTKYLNGILETK